jgi:hypothetical protein
MKDKMENQATTEGTLKERAAVYGPFHIEAERIKEIKDILAGHHDAEMVSRDMPHPDPVVEHVTNMIVMKLVRLHNGSNRYRDNWQDIAGYAELMCRDIDRTNDYQKGYAGGLSDLPPEATRNMRG